MACENLDQPAHLLTSQRRFQKTILSMLVPSAATIFGGSRGFIFDHDVSYASFVTIKRSVWIKLSVVALLPISALAFIKPLRMITPQIVRSVHCYPDGICIDNQEKLVEAQTLYSSALAKAAKKVGPFRSPPRITFCSTTQCRDDFGLGARAAATIGDFGIAVAPRGWKEFYVTHELIHYRQAEEIGNITVLLKPSWLIEGMAYSLSEDPRILTEPFESWRTRFEGWSTFRGVADFWQAAEGAKAE